MLKKLSTNVNTRTVPRIGNGSCIVPVLEPNYRGSLADAKPILIHGSTYVPVRELKLLFHYLNLHPP